MSGRLAPAHEVVEQGLRAAPSSGGCVVIVEDSSELEVRFANNTTTTNGTRRNRRVTVVATAPRPGGIGCGVASASGPVDIAELVRRAAAIAESADAAPDAAPLVAEGLDERFDDPPPLIEADALTGVVEGLAQAFARAERERRVLAGFATTELLTRTLGTSSGARRRHVQPTGALQLVGRSTDGERSAWASRAGADLAREDLEGLEARLAGRLEIARRRVELPAGRYEVLLPPDAAADLFLVLAEAAGGRDAEDGRSVFSRRGGGTRVGDQLAPLPLELFGDPGATDVACAPFLAVGSSGPDVSVFDDGAAIGRTAIIEHGRLARLRYHRAGAARAGVAFTPPVDNLILEQPGATSDLDALIASTRRGLLLTCLWYIREVDASTLLLTGLTRDGVYLVEDGEIVAAVNNFRFNESPVDMLKRTVEVGRSERALSREWGEWWNRTRMPALRVEGFNMSSVSPAQ